MIAENHWDGHRLFYVKLLVEEALSLGHVVTLILRKNIKEHEEFRQHLQHLLSNISFYEIDLISINVLETFSLDLKPDLLVIPDADAYLVPLFRNGGWKGKCILNLLIMREIAESRLRISFFSELKTIAKSLATYHVSRLRNINIVLLKAATWRGSSRYRVALDPIQIASTDSQKIALSVEAGLSPETYWVGIVGRNDMSKRPELIANAIAHLKDPTIGLALLGKLTDEMHSTVQAIDDTLTQSENPLRVLPRVLNDSEFDSALEIVDCNIIVRTVIAPSAVVGKCLAIGSRAIVVGNRKELSAVDVSNYPLHFLAVEPKISSVADAIKQFRQEMFQVPRINFPSKSFTEPLLSK